MMTLTRRTFGISYEDCCAGKSRVSSAISVCDNFKNFKIGFSTVVVAQWVKQWNSGQRVVQAEGLSPGGDKYQIFFSNDFYFSFVWTSVMYSDTL